MPWHSSPLIQLASSEQNRILDRKINEWRKSAPLDVKAVHRVDARLAKHGKKPLTGEEAMALAEFYRTASRHLCVEGIPERIEGHRCVDLALRYYKMAEKRLPMYNKFEAKAALLSLQDMHNIAVAKTRRELIAMIQRTDVDAYDVALTLLLSYTCSFKRLPKTAIAAVESVINRYEKEIAKLREEIELGRNPIDPCKA